MIKRRPSVLHDILSAVVRCSSQTEGGHTTPTQLSPNSQEALPGGKVFNSTVLGSIEFQSIQTVQQDKEFGALSSEVLFFLMASQDEARCTVCEV